MKKYLIVLVLIILASAGFAYYQMNKPVANVTSEPVVGTTNQETSNSQVFVDNETADWQTYKSDKYGFEFKYPKTLKIHDVNEKNISGKFYLDIPIGQSEIDWDNPSSILMNEIKGEMKLKYFKLTELTDKFDGNIIKFAENRYPYPVFPYPGAQSIKEIPIENGYGAEVNGISESKSYGQHRFRAILIINKDRPDDFYSFYLQDIKLSPSEWSNWSKVLDTFKLINEKKSTKSKNCVNTKYGYELNYPDGWNVLAKSGGGSKIATCDEGLASLFFVKDIPSDLPLKNQINLIVNTRDNQAEKFWQGINSLDDYVNRRLSYSWKKQKETIVDGERLVWLEYNQGSQLVLVAYHNSAIYEFSIYSVEKVVLDNFLESFKFTK